MIDFSVLSGHIQATAASIAAATGLVYIAHDTIECDFEREWTASEQAGKKPRGKAKAGASQGYTEVTILMHSACAMSRDGVYLGVVAAMFFTRDKLKGDDELFRNETPKGLRPNSSECGPWIDVLRQAGEAVGDPGRCVHTADRGGDSDDFINAAVELGTKFLIRIRDDRSTGDGAATTSDVVELSAVGGIHRLDVKDRDGNDDLAELEIRACRGCINPPSQKGKRLAPLTVTVICAEEKGTPKNRKRIVWKLMTDLPVQSRGDAIEILESYALRWNIEDSRKAAKSGCKTENSKLGPARRLTHVVATNCVVAWRVHYLRMLNQARPDAWPEEGLTSEEIEMLDAHAANDRGRSLKDTLSDYIREMAMLGGYLGRNNDRPPGKIVMARGMYTLILMCEGARGRRKRS